MKTNRKILWGAHPVTAPSPVKICAYSKAAFNRRQKEGWTLEICDAGERPVWLLSTVDREPTESAAWQP
jgi:hypothetical protein